MTEATLVVVRGTVAFVTLLMITRMLGKKQISQLSFFDYIVGITIGSMAATAVVNLEVAPLPALAGILTWGALTVFLSYGTVKSLGFRKFITGEPTVVIENGRILERNLAKELLTIDDLLRLLREQQVFNLNDVEAALFETNGRLSVLLKGERQAVTAGHLQLPLAQQEMPVELIDDGRVLKETLARAGKDLGWLKQQLREQGVDDIGEVAVAQLDGRGSLFVDLYDDAKVEPHRPHTTKLLHANLLRFESQMESLALDSKDKKVADLYLALAAEAAEVREGLQGL